MKVHPNSQDNEGSAPADLLSLDSDSDNNSNSIDSELSYSSHNNFLHFLQTSPICSKVVAFDILSWFPFYSKSIFHASKKSQPISDSLGYKSSVLVNYLEGNNSRCFRDDNKKEVFVASNSPVSSPSCAGSLSYVELNQIRPIDSELHVVKSGKSTLPGSSTPTTYTSVHSTSSLSDLSLPSFGGIVPPTIIFANQCLERSQERRKLILEPQMSLLNESYSRSHCPNSSIKSSLLSHLPIASPSSTGPLSVTLYKSSPSSSLPYLYKAPTTIQMIEKLLHDVSQHSSRIQRLKRERRSMEIKYCRQRCIQSLRNSMLLYNKLNANSISDSKLERKFNHIDNRKVVSTGKMISRATIESVCFNLVLSMVYMLLFLYKDSFSHMTFPPMLREAIIYNNNL